MRVVGFNFNKINVEKFSDNTKGVKINSNVDISSINPVKAEMFKTKEEFLGVKFTYTIDYNPDFAKLELSGTILIGLDPKQSKEVQKQWKDKKMPEDFRVFIFNVILRKSNLKALELEEELSIPLHLPMPSVKKQNQQNQKKQE